MRREILTMTPQRADPLGWFLGVRFPVVVSVAVVIYAATFVAVTWSTKTVPLLQGAAAVLVALACWHIVEVSRPQRGFVRLRHAIAPLLLSWAAAACSAYGFYQGNAGLASWWGPACVLAVIFALTPYSSAIALAVYGALGGVICALLVFFGHQSGPALTMLVTAAAMPLLAGMAGAVFAGVVVDGVIRWNEQPAESRGEPSASREIFDDWLRRHGAPGEPAGEILSFFSQIAASGRVSIRDRERATALAEVVRADLVRRLNRSWLDTLPATRGLEVVDPERLAETMTLAERSAVRGVLSTVLSSSVLSQNSLRIELRGQPDGSTAVGLSMRIDLPEGERVMMLAPYFLNLGYRVDDFEWAGGELLRLRFQLPARADSARGIRSLETKPTTGPLTTNTLNEAPVVD